MGTESDIVQELRDAENQGLLKTYCSYHQQKKDNNTLCKHKQEILHLKQLLQVKTDFINMIFHDIRTPLSSMKGYIQMLLKM